MRVYGAVGYSEKETVTAIHRRLRERGHAVTVDWTEYQGVEVPSESARRRRSRPGLSATSPASPRPTYSSCWPSRRRDKPGTSISASPSTPTPSRDARLEIFTVGHSNHTQDAFVALLRLHAIDLVVDVRSAPASRYAPQFNRRHLAADLARHGIGYAFAGDRLGGGPTDPACYKTGTVPDGAADYLKMVDYPVVARQPWFRGGVDRLVEMAPRQRVVVMCSEEDPARCHRHHLVAQALLERGVVVRHIRRDGAVEDALPLAAGAATAQLALFGGNLG